MSKQVPARFLVVMIWVAAITWVLVMFGACSIKRDRTPAKQQNTPHVTTVPNIDIPVEQIDTNRDGRISHTEASNIHMTNTTTPIVIFLCVGAATLFSCIICVWAARRIPRNISTPDADKHTPVDEDPDFLSSTSARNTREPAAPTGKTERLRRSNDK